MLGIICSRVDFNPTLIKVTVWTTMVKKFQGTAFLISHMSLIRNMEQWTTTYHFPSCIPKTCRQKLEETVWRFYWILLDYSSFLHFLNGQRLLRSVSSCSPIPSRVARFYHKSSILCHKGRRRKTSIFFGRGKGRSGSQGSTEAERKAYHYHCADRTLSNSKDIYMSDILVGLPDSTGIVMPKKELLRGHRLWSHCLLKNIFGIQ